MTNTRAFATAHENKESHLRATFYSDSVCKFAGFLAKKPAPMRMKIAFALLAIFAPGGGNGVAAGETAANRPVADLAARIHFIGMTQVAANPKAASFNAIWQLPATQELVDKTIGKLATAPYRIFQSHFTNHNDHADQLRPLFRDLLNNESYVEIRGATNAIPEVLLAVRLEKNRADAWRTAIAGALSAWTEIPVKEIAAEGFSGWELRKHHNPNCIRFFLAGDWVVLGWGWNDLLLQPGMLQRIKEKKRPVPATRDYTLDAWVDWPALLAGHPLQLPFAGGQLPKMQLTVTNAPDFIRTRMVMQFPKPLDLKLEPWQIPAETIRNKIFSFTAVRGIAPWLGQIDLIKSLDLKSVPNEWFIWAQDVPFETCFAAPVGNAKDYLKQLAPKLTLLVNSNLAKVHLTQGCGVDTNGDLHVAGFPFSAPYLRAGDDSGKQFLFGGVMPSHKREDPVPPALYEQITSRPNLVYYDWEITDARIEQWRVSSQLALIVERKVITDTNAPAQKWITASKKKLGNCTTVVTLSAPNELTLVRNGAVGFTGAELTGLAIWLDAPEFPMMPHFRPQFPDEAEPAPPGKSR
jgi:hypothetical protein